MDSVTAKLDTTRSLLEKTNHLNLAMRNRVELLGRTNITANNDLEALMHTCEELIEQARTLIDPSDTPHTK